ncbi:MAG: putative Serine-type D-Ala-D-Ala carboxypeptidase [Candidatus Saccharibacteria bacterium]|nr:putative Serine-type D-Ala-D-Ala carboxypeptidase [Candidatus Saccharibacteria bacterium]
MRKPVQRGFRKLLRRHLVGIIIIAVSIIATAGFLYWYTSTTEAKIATIKKHSAAQSAAADVQIKVIKAQKAAELKAKQEAAAKAAADQAQIADSSTATSVNSSDCNTATTHNNPASIDVVVNKKHCIQPVTYIPGDLVSIGSGYVLSAKAAPSFNEMMAAASAAGISLSVTSSYRSYSDQVSTYAYWVNTSGKAGADTYSARPGYSEHQTGLAFDISSNGCVLSCFGSSTAYTWMQANAATYGFIQRYYAGSESITGYDAEEWHYRYVGTTVAKDMEAKSIKTLEQYWGISGGNYY